MQFMIKPIAAALCLAAISTGASAQLMLSTDQAKAAGITVQPEKASPIAIPGLAPKARPAAPVAAAPLLVPVNAEPAQDADKAPAAVKAEVKQDAKPAPRTLPPQKKVPVQKKSAGAGTTTAVSTTGGDTAGPVALNGGAPTGTGGLPADEAAKVDAVMQKILAAQMPQQASASASPSAPAAQDELTITRGVTEMIPVSQNAMSHFTVPFQTPIIMKDARAGIKVKSAPGSIFVSMGEEKAGIYVYDEADPENVMSIQLIPRDIPQRDIRLSFKVGGGSRNKKADAFEQAQPYTQTLGLLLTEVAQGKKPAGYSFEKAKGYEITCKMEGVQLRLAQVMTGANFQIGVFSARNVSGDVLEINEQACGQDKVAAVAAFPSALLQQGDTTELYVVKRIAEEPDGTERPTVN